MKGAEAGHTDGVQIESTKSEIKDESCGDITRGKKKFLNLLISCN